MKNKLKFLRQYFGLGDLIFPLGCIAMIIWGFKLHDENTVIMTGAGALLLSVWFAYAIIRILKNKD